MTISTYIIFVRGSPHTGNSYPGVLCTVKAVDREQACRRAAELGPNIYEGQWLAALPWGEMSREDHEMHSCWQEQRATREAQRTSSQRDA
jgi:hypothetical protein